MTQSNPFCNSIISSYHITKSHYDDIIIKNGRCSDVIVTFISFLSYLRGVFPQLPVHPSTECTRTDTLHSDPFLFFDRTCHKTQSQTNRHPSIKWHSYHRQPLASSIGRQQLQLCRSCRIDGKVLETHTLSNRRYQLEYGIQRPLRGH